MSVVKDSVVEKKIPYGEHTLVMRTGDIAQQATGAVLVSLAGTSVLVTVVGIEDQKTTHDFLPLRVESQRRAYASGKIPGGFFRREGRPSEQEILGARLIDRPLRPLFPEGFTHEVQIVATVLSLNPEIDSDILSMIGASAALAISGIPCNGIMGAARVGYHAGQYLLNPTCSQLKTSELDLVVAGTDHSILMVESEVHELSEAVVLGAVLFGHQASQTVIQAIRELAEQVGRPTWNWVPPLVDKALESRVRERYENEIAMAYGIADKAGRVQRLRQIKAEATETLLTEMDITTDKAGIEQALAQVERSLIRGRILAGERRIDGRDHQAIRPITVQPGWLPRVHGSALFTRGQTQALVVATLGTTRDAQMIESPTGEQRDPFMLHYNFPPYSVGEVGMVGSPKRREIGHGMLAKRAIRPVLPNDTEFPYVLRVVSEITACNGSSSMATVCGTSLALMDAGVPITAAVAGIAMGLVKEGERYQVLSDILGDEDHLGDMDFKVAGTAKGITALQMDIKIDGVTEAIMQVALEQARAGRLHILEQMNAAIATPRSQISAFAPQIISFRIHPEKIRDVIGKGGAVIRALTEETGVTIDISDEGVIQIAAVDKAAGDEARRRIELITADVEIGKIYEGKVVRIAEFGAFVNFLPGKDGLVHISQMAEHRVERVEDVVQEGQTVSVRVLEIDRQGRVRLSMRVSQDS